MITIGHLLLWLDHLVRIPRYRPVGWVLMVGPVILVATLWHFRHKSRVTSPPIWVQNLMLPPLWALAKAFGVRPYYDRWDSRIRGSG